MFQCKKNRKKGGRGRPREIERETERKTRREI